MSTRQDRSAFDLARFFLALGLLLAFGTQVRAQTNLTKYDNTIPANSDGTSTNGRIPLGSNGRGDDLHTLIPFVLKDGSTYKMWYTGHDGISYRIYYATSSNGLEWTKYTNTVPANSDTNSTGGRIPLGTGGTGDDTHTWYSSVLKDGSTYKMWYTGYGGAKHRSYYATSSNGLEWTKYDNTIPADSDGASTNGKIPLGTAGKGDATYALGPSVIKDGPSDYKMWYSGSDGTVVRIYYATSSNGLEWTKYDNTIPANSDGASTNGKIPRGTAGKGDSQHVQTPIVLKDGSTYKMWYVGYDASTIARVYHATSSNGLEWTKYDNTIPANSNTTNSNSRLGLGTAGGDVTYVSHPKGVVFEGENGRRYYKLWYSGYDGVNWRIYHATGLVPPPAGTVFTFR